MKKIVIILLLTVSYCHLAIGQVGTWKAYLAYSDIQQIQKADDNLFVMASNGLYQYNLNDQSIFTYDKTNGLSDTYITHIRWSSEAKRLIIVYQNSNIDLIETNGNVINISDLYLKAMTSDKTVKSVRIDGVYAYLVCGFGIVKVNMKRAEIADSYTPNHPQYPTELPTEDNSDYNEYIETVKTLNPGGPKYNYFFNMLTHKGRLYTVGGGWYQFDNYHRPGTIQVLENDEWTLFQDDMKPAFAAAYRDVNSIAIDPLDDSHVMAATCSGVYEFVDGEFKYNYTAGNTDYFESAAGTAPAYVRTDGIVYDREGNLYCLNSSSTSGIIKRSKDGEWSGIMDDQIADWSGKSLPNMKGSIMDGQNRIWFVNEHSDNPAFFSFDPLTKDVKKYNNFSNQDGISLSPNRVHCVCEDKDGNLWVGTDKGPVYLTDNEMNHPTSGVIQHKVPRNDGSDYADYLLTGTNITCIAIDGAGQKWFGTGGNGVYLISYDNNEQIQHFTAENSPLLSNSIESIAINHQTGEVFFGTELGLCSYVSAATAPAESMDKNNVYAYPNPVNFNDYSGLITVTGLTYNADVKILSSSGKLIAEGHSNGGTFTWDGCDREGNRVASGVYMVVTATSDGKKGTVCKIAIIK